MANAILIPHHFLCVLVGGKGAQTVQSTPGDRFAGCLMSVLRHCGNAIRCQRLYQGLTNQRAARARGTRCSVPGASSHAALLRPRPGGRTSLSSLAG